MERHLYLLNIKLPSMNQGKWNQLSVAMRGLGQRNRGPKPNLRNHFRRNLPNDEIIFEGSFLEENIEDQWFIDWLADDQLVDPSVVEVVTIINEHGRRTTYLIGGVAFFQILILGWDSDWPTYEESLVDAHNYLADNRVDWDEPVEDE